MDPRIAYLFWVNPPPEDPDDQDEPLEPTPLVEVEPVQPETGFTVANRKAYVERYQKPDPIVERGGILFQRCGGGVRVLRKR